MSEWYDIVGRGGHFARRGGWGRRRGYGGYGGYGWDMGGDDAGGYQDPQYPQYPQYPYPQYPYPQLPAPALLPVPVTVPTPPVASGSWPRYLVGSDGCTYPVPPQPQYANIPPRNALVQDPGPDRAGREVLPMSTGVAILPTQSAQITARPQRVAFRPERVFISAAGTSGGAADWVVNDIKIGNRSQFSQSGDVPGDMFATNAIDGFVSFETAQTAMDVVMVVTYIGLNESGVPFFASIVGTAAI